MTRMILTINWNMHYSHPNTCVTICCHMLLQAGSHQLYEYSMKHFFPLIALTCLSMSLVALERLECQILVGGGTLAGLGAVLAAPVRQKVCVVEPTEKMGGQLGEEGVWHIDFNWLYQSGYPDNTTAYNHVNLHPFLRTLTDNCNTGDCWVSRNCFLYVCVNQTIQQYLAPLIAAGNLNILYNSLITAVERKLNRVTGVTVVSRSALKEDCREADERIADWYSPTSSDFYSKTITNISVVGFAIEATQYGDLLALSKAPFTQGTKQSQTCGQSIVFGIHQQYQQTKPLSVEAIFEEGSNEDGFSLGGYSAEQVWRYRRLKGRGLGAKAGQLSLQNWNGPGNDYRDGYLFVSNNDFTDEWKGGLNFTTLRQAQARSLRFHQWFKQLTNWPIKISGKYLNSCRGVTLLPYIRDGRRSVGYKNFTLAEGDVAGLFDPVNKVTGTVFNDRVGLGFYNMDVHSIESCEYEPYAQKLPLPFFLPFRAMTNKEVSNLVVAGRAMAQTFYTSTATRTHSTQLHSGIGSMLSASYMLKTRLNSTWTLSDCDSCIYELQQNIRRVMPIEWTIAGRQYPAMSYTTSM